MAGVQVASFHPKPLPTQSGTGAHLHFSVNQVLPQLAASCLQLCLSRAYTGLLARAQRQ